MHSDVIEDCELRAHTLTLLRIIPYSLHARQAHGSQCWYFQFIS